MSGPKIAGRGFLIVTLVAWNVVNVASHQYGWALVTGTLVSVVWWQNASIVSEAKKHPRASWWYGLGAGLGTIAGMYLGS